MTKRKLHWDEFSRDDIVAMFRTLLPALASAARDHDLMQLAMKLDDATHVVRGWRSSREQDARS